MLKGKIFIISFLTILVFLNCTCNRIKNNDLNTGETKIIDNSLWETAEVKFFRIHDVDNEYQYEYQIVQISRENIVEDTNRYMSIDSWNPLRIKNIFYDGLRIIIDLDANEDITATFGSAGGEIRKNELLHTFASYPGVHEIKFLFEGNDAQGGEHFDLAGVFNAYEYRNH